MTMAQLLRSGVKRKFHAPFCSGGRGREAPPYRNWAAAEWIKGMRWIDTIDRLRATEAWNGVGQ